MCQSQTHQFSVSSHNQEEVACNYTASSPLAWCYLLANCEKFMEPIIIRKLKWFRPIFANIIYKEPIIPDCVHHHRVNGVASVIACREVGWDLQVQNKYLITQKEPQPALQFYSFLDTTRWNIGSCCQSSRAWYWKLQPCNSSTNSR